MSMRLVGKPAGNAQCSRHILLLRSQKDASDKAIEISTEVSDAIVELLVILLPFVSDQEDVNRDARSASPFSWNIRRESSNCYAWIGEDYHRYDVSISPVT
jgi:hypothetical protein